MNYSIIIGFLIGFLFFIWITRGQGRQPIIFQNIFVFGKHLHHWMIFTIVFLITALAIYIYGEYNDIGGFLLGISLGSILQGLTYSDAFII
jgi:hypothetical protein